MPMLKAGQIRCCQELEKLGRHVVDKYKPHSVFLIDCVLKIDSFVSKRDLAM